MTVPSITNRSGPYNGNGVTTAFDYDFRILDDEHISVILLDASGVEHAKTLTTDYTVTGVGGTDGGQVNMIVPPASGETLTILRDVPFTQETDLENQGAYYAETVEAALDLAAMRDQQLSERLDRSVQIPASSPVDDLENVIANILYFADVYLGPKTSDPTTRNDGSPLQEGDMYFNTAADQMRIYASPTWIVVGASMTPAAGTSVWPVATLADLRALPTALGAAELLESGKRGSFKWDGSNLAATLAPRSIVSVSVDAAADTYSLRSVLTTSVNSGTDTLTFNNHGFANDELVTVTATVDGLITGGQYHIYNATTNTFQLRTSLTAGSAVDLTGTTNVTVRGQHLLQTGMCLMPTTTANGVTAGQRYYVIRVNEAQWKLATSMENAMAGVAVDLTNTTNQTFKLLIDPREAMYVIHSGDAIDGSAGAWVRNSSRVSVAHCGAVGDGVTDDWAAIQAAVWLGYFLKLPTYVPGSRNPYMSSNSIRHITVDKLSVSFLGSAALKPNNGITIFGDGPELSAIRCSAAFPNNTHLLYLNGNGNGVAAIVGSNPYAQGVNFVSGISLQGRGQAVGTLVKGLGFCGIWGLNLDNFEMAGFSGDTIEHFSYAPAASGGDDLDTSAFITMRNFRLLSGGGNGFSAIIARPAQMVLDGFQIANFLGCGFIGGPIASEFRNGSISACGVRATVTTGGMRLVNALTATGLSSICRNVALTNVTFENNFNFELNPQQVLGLLIDGGAYNLYEPTGGVVANKCVVRVGTGCSFLTVNGGHFQDYSAPSDGPIYDAPYFDIASGAADIKIINPKFVHATAHVTLQTGVRFDLTGYPGAAITITGSQPDDSYNDGVQLGTRNSTPTVEGISTAGVSTNSINTLRWWYSGGNVEFSWEYTQSAHTGTGGLRAVLAGLPQNFPDNMAVAIYQEGLTYTSYVQCLAQGGTKNLLFRQAASASANTVIAVPAGVATIRIRGSFKRA